MKNSRMKVKPLTPPDQALERFLAKAGPDSAAHQALEREMARSEQVRLMRTSNPGSLHAMR